MKLKDTGLTVQDIKDKVNKSKAPNEDEYYQLTFGDIIR